MALLRSGSSLDALAAHGERLDGNVVSFGIEAGAVPLARPGGKEIPAHLLGSGIVAHDHGSVFALELPGDGCDMPVVQFGGIRGSPFERNVRVAGLSDQFAHGGGVAAFTVLGYFHVRAQPAAFSKSGLLDTVYLHSKTKSLVWVYPPWCCHWYFSF